MFLIYLSGIVFVPKNKMVQRIIFISIYWFLVLQSIVSVSSAATQLHCRKLKHWLISNLSTWSCSSKSWETDPTRVLHLDSDNHTNDNIAQANCSTSFARAVLLVRTVVQQIVNKKTSASISNILGTYKNFMCNLTRTPSWVAGSILLARNMKWIKR